MVYLQYELAKQKYNATFDAVQSVIDEHEMLFLRTQPHGMDYGKDRVDGGGGVNPFDAYLESKEAKHIDKRIRDGMTLLKERLDLVMIREQEVRASKQMIDRIYTLRYLNNLKVYKIASAVGYSEKQVYRYLIEIEKSKKRRMSENVTECPTMTK